MAQLSTIISSILRDMIVAQHEANMYAVSLEEIYKKNGRLERFSLPSANISEVRITGDRYIGSLFMVDEPVPMIPEVGCWQWVNIKWAVLHKVNHHCYLRFIKRKSTKIF